MTDRPWHKLVALTFNTHAGLAIKSGGLDRLLDHAQPDVVFLQEVQRPTAKVAARKALPWIDWHKIGPRMTSPAGTYIFARKDRFTVEEKVDVLLSRKVPNERRPELWPERRLTGAILFDRETRRYVRASCIHTWALGDFDLDGQHKVAEGHRRQVSTYAYWHSLSDAPDVDLCAGDLNEHLDGRGISPTEQPVSAVSVFEHLARMEPAFIAAKVGERKVHLDDVFVRTDHHTRVASRLTITLGERFRADHPAVVSTLKIKEKS